MGINNHGDRRVALVTRKEGGKMRRFPIVIFVCVFLISGIANADLIAHYTFDGNADDISGNGNNGTEVGTISYSDSILGQAANFDGNSYITVPDDDLFDVDEMSLGAWIMIDSLPGQSKIILGDSASPVEERIFQFYIEPTGELTFLANTEDDSVSFWDIYITTTNQVSVGNWYYIAATFDQINGGNIWVNGANWGTDTEFNGTLLKGNPQIEIGGTSHGSYYLDGSIDDLRFYNQALSGSEILELYDAPNPIPEPATMLLLGSGLIVLAGFRRKDKKV